ncbi:zinc-finger domain-containing protein [Mariprofundus sp. EBB-1]|nr:zinc-finger domain-containing protein [Mariprofundus sp. EBB-1]
MNSNLLKTTAEVIPCSNNGLHPLVYISLKSGIGKCQCCGKQYINLAMEQ